VTAEKKVIAIIAQGQFGYHTDYFNWTKYLLPDFDILYFDFYNNKENCYLPGVKIIRLKKTGYNLLDIVRILFKYFQGSLRERIDVSFIEYFKYCSLFRILWWKRLVVDNRSGYIEQDEKIRRRRNKMLAFEVSLFPFSTIVSESLRNELKLDPEKSIVMPLGAVDYKFHSRNSDLNLLYVGVLDKRRIYDTISGLSIFMKKNPTKLQYNIINIIGYGSDDEIKKLIKTIQEEGLEKTVAFHGPLWHNDLLKYLENTTLGIVYVPKIPAYDNQPPTKLFEFLLNGIPVLATSTHEMTSYIGTENGVLIEDNPSSFAEGLENLIARLPYLKPESIKESVKDNTWECIVRNRLVNIIHKIAGN
jgi:hypothetical protein